MLFMVMSITPRARGEKGQTVGRPVGQTRGHQPSNEGNPRLRSERLVRHWEQDDVASGLQELAALLGEAAPGVDGNLVSKWERGVRTPGPYYTPRLCLLFQLPPEQLGFVPGPRLSSECRTLSQVMERALARKVGSVRRREFLQHLLWGGAVLASWSALDAERIVAAASGHIDRRLLDDLHVLANDYARRMHTEAPRDLLPQVERHLTYVRGILRNSQPSVEEGRLHLIAGTLAAVAGRLSFSLGNAGDAHAHYAVAEGHAREAGEGPLRAYVLGMRRQLYSDLWRGWQGPGSSMPLRLLDEAHAAAGTGSSPWLRTWLLATRAEEHAMRGDARAAQRDLEEADHLLGTATSGEDGLLAHWYDSPVARLAGYRGKCAELLGDSAEATTMIEEALGAFPPSLVSCRCYALVDLAAAYAKEEEVERACGLLAESLDLGSEKGLAGHVQRVIGVRQHLARWPDAAAVRDLDEQLHHLTWAPA
jgi:transcriptional regulator with XRE-family HTH domain